MTPVRRTSIQMSSAAVMAMPTPTPSTWSRLEVTLLNARDGLLIVCYTLALRVLILARRWNY